MTSEFLKGYRSKKDEIEELTVKINNIGHDDSLVGNDVIFDYRSGYPVAQAVVAVNREKCKRVEQKYKNRREKLKEECRQVEEYIESISDSLTRRIFRMYYIDGYTQSQIANRVNLDRSSVSRKIDNFLKVAHNSHNAHL